MHGDERETELLETYIISDMLFAPRLALVFYYVFIIFYLSFQTIRKIYQQYFKIKLYVFESELCLCNSLHKKVVQVAYFL